MTEARRDSKPERYSLRARRRSRGWYVFFAVASLVFAIAAFIGLGVWGDPSREIETARADVRTIRPLASRYRESHGGACATPLQLRSERANLPVVDPWGTAYAVRCSDEGIKVVSFGPDKKDGTPDDITEPD